MAARCPVVSIVIPTFNSERFVGAALDSAMDQSLSDLEIIVVDDCSTDGTVDLVSGFVQRDPRVRLVALESNIGPAGARNVAIEQARGSWLAVLDSDDLFAADRLERMVALAIAHEVDLIADDLTVFDDQDQRIKARFLKSGTNAGWIDLRHYLRETVIYGGGQDFGFLKPMFRLDKMRNEGWRYDTRLRVGEDDDLVLRMLLGGSRYWLASFPGYFYRKHGASVSHRLSAANAGAMADAARDLISSDTRPSVQGALRRRAAALRRATSFAALLEALRSKSFATALGIAAANPGCLRLFSIPLKDRAARLFRKRSRDDAATGPEGPTSTTAAGLSGLQK